MGKSAKMIITIITLSIMVTGGIVFYRYSENKKVAKLEKENMEMVNSLGDSLMEEEYLVQALEVEKEKIKVIILKTPNISDFEPVLQKDSEAEFIFNEESMKHVDIAVGDYSIFRIKNGTPMTKSIPPQLSEVDQLINLGNSKSRK